MKQGLLVLLAEAIEDKNYPSNEWCDDNENHLFVDMWNKLKY